jgi:hypothetical protein
MAHHQQELSEWIEIVSRKLPHLYPAEVKVLALYSFGAVLSHSCGISKISALLSMLLGQNPNTLRQRLGELTYEGQDKRGEKRRSLPIEDSFADLLKWVLSWWASSEERLALVLDATSFRNIFTVLTLSVVYRGCAIPVAWKVLKSEQKGEWQPHWEDLIDHLRAVVPAHWFVLVLADRGLYAQWLYQKCIQVKWHPFRPINQQGQFRPHGNRCFRLLSKLVHAQRPDWSGRVTCFKTQACQLNCTLLGHYDPTYKDPWLVVTDLPPKQADIAWYGMRSWVECGFKDLKRGGWGWHHTKMTDPARAERLWLVLTVATLWTLSMGGYAETHLPASSFAPLPAQWTDAQKGYRRLSCFTLGQLAILAAFIQHVPVFVCEFVYEQWPHSSRKLQALC